MPRECWSEEKIAERVLELAKEYGRMPSSSEFRSHGENALFCALTRYGGATSWADKLGLSKKESCTLQGRAMEAEVSGWLSERGHSVERQSVKHPFDLLVNDSLRIDVKSANWSDCYRKSDGARVSGFVFAGLKYGKVCDLFVLVCLGPPEDVTFIVPASDANVSTLTITKKSLEGRGKYAGYRERWDIFEAMAKP